MMTTYHEDATKCFEIMAIHKGSRTHYEDNTPVGRNKHAQQQKSARKRCLCC